jgi:hypothetical protein
MRGERGGLLVQGNVGGTEFLAASELLEFLASVGASRLALLVSGGSAAAARWLAHELASSAAVEVNIADARDCGMYAAVLNITHSMPPHHFPGRPAVRYQSPLSSPSRSEDRAKLRLLSEEFLSSYTIVKSLRQSSDSSNTVRWLQVAQRYLEHYAAWAFEHSLPHTEGTTRAQKLGTV